MKYLYDILHNKHFFIDIYNMHTQKKNQLPSSNTRIVSKYQFSLIF